MPVPVGTHVYLGYVPSPSVYTCILVRARQYRRTDVLFIVSKIWSTHGIMNAHTHCSSRDAFEAHRAILVLAGANDSECFLTTLFYEFAFDGIQ